MTKIQRGNADYWINAVAAGEEDYYAKPGEASGRWLGSEAAALGLEGEIDRDSYAAALAGRDPTTGETLVRRPEPRSFTDASGRECRLEPVLGFDVRFAAPKSVSLLYAVGSPEAREAVLRAHDQAVAAAIGYLEQNACFVGRGKGGARVEPGRGLLAMAFRHRSSRAGDPALHTHVLVANMTRAVSDQRWLSLASPRRRSPFWQHAKPAGYLYQAALRANVTRELGLDWHHIHNGYADLVDIERPVIEHFSRRRTEITEALAERGLDSARAAEVAAYRTRDAKERDVAPDVRREEWISRAAEFDLSADSINSCLAAVTSRQPKFIQASDLEAALAELENHRSHFDRRDLICALANQLPEGADPSELASAADRVLASERVIEIHAAASPLDPTFFTTPRLWAQELRFLEIARAKEPVTCVVPDHTLAAVLERHRYLGADQAEMVRRLATGAERIAPVAALPGTGKTTALAAAREAWEEAGYPVIGVASARSASGELADAGVPSTSIAALLIETEEWEGRGVSPLAPGTVIVLDEASTVSTPHAAALAELAKCCDGKLVAIGDPRQIGAVGPGGLYGHLTRVIEPSVLTEIRRQRDRIDREIVELAHRGRGSDALDILRAKDRLRIADSLPQALDALALDWHERFSEGEDAVMIARRTRDVAELNARALELLAACRDPSAPTLEIAGHRFVSGDQILTRLNTSQVSNRERWQVVSIDPDAGTLELTRIGPHARRICLGAEYLERRTASGEPAIQHSYALTAYATEAKTFDSAFVLLDAGINREEFLVEVSRARGATNAYGVAALDLSDPQLGPGLRTIEDEAHEIRAASERPGSDHPALEAEARERIAAQPTSVLAQRRSEVLGRLTGPSVAPAQRRLDALERRIALTTSRIEDLHSSHAALLDHPRPDPRQLARIESDRRLATRQLDQLTDEQRSLAPDSAIEAGHPTGLSAADKLDLALIEDRLEQLRRREVAAERLQPSELVLQTLGSRPLDPTEIALWNQGVDTLHAYRYSRGLSSTDGHPLGSRPRGAREIREWRAARQSLERIQRGLDIESGHGIERSISALP